MVMKAKRRNVRTRRVETQARDKNDETVEVRVNGKWLGLPRWVYDTWFVRSAEKPKGQETS